MPRNIFGGNKAKRKKNVGKPVNKSLRVKDNSSLELYGKVLKRLGGNPPVLLVLCEDGKERKCVVRGKFVKKVWMNPDDYVLITRSSEIGDGGEVTCKYDKSEVTQLEDRKELDCNKFNKNTEVDSNIIFTNEQATNEIVDDYYSTNNEGNNESTNVVDDDEIDIDEI